MTAPSIMRGKMNIVGIVFLVSVVLTTVRQTRNHQVFLMMDESSGLWSSTAARTIDRSRRLSHSLRYTDDAINNSMSSTTTTSSNVVAIENDDESTITTTQPNESISELPSYQSSSLRATNATPERISGSKSHLSTLDDIEEDGSDVDANFFDGNDENGSDPDVVDDTVDGRHDEEDGRHEVDTTIATNHSIATTSFYEYFNVPEMWRQNQVSPGATWWTDPSVVLPENDNTVIALISFGGTRSTLIVERCIRSIRTSGNFTGYIMVLTDSSGTEKYNHTLSWDPKTLVLGAKSQDVKPRDSNGQVINYHQKSTMHIKRFKTLLMDYVDVHPLLSDKTRYILYLDADNIVTQSLSKFFHDYQTKISNDFEKAKATLAGDEPINLSNNSNNSDRILDPGFSFFSFWRDGKLGKSTDYWQGGQTMYDRLYSRGCAAAWKFEMDTKYSFLDQPLLYHVYENFDFYKCKVFDMGKRSKHFSLVTPSILNFHNDNIDRKNVTSTNGKKKKRRRRRLRNLPTFVHITSLRAKKFPLSLQTQLIRKAMHLPPLEHSNSNNTITATSSSSSSDSTMNKKMMMVNGISWDEVASPSGSRGQSLHKTKKRYRKKKKKKKTTETTTMTDRNSTIF